MKRFVICNASAGAGKTYTLVRHYIETAIQSERQLEDGFKHILAITFTNKSANEMKERILSDLRSIVVGDVSRENLTRELAERLGLEVEEVRRRCSRLLSAIMHNYSDFSVSTIDSFVYRLVRSFAYELRLPMNFDVLIEDQELLERTVDQLLTQAGGEGNDALTDLLCAFVESRMDDGKSFQIAHHLTELSKEVLKEETPEYLDWLAQSGITGYKDFHKELQRANRQVEEALIADGQAVVDACTAAGLTVADFPYKESGVYGYFDRFSRGDMQGINKTYARVEKMVESGVAYAKTASPDVRTRIESVTPTLIDAYRRMQRLITDERKRYNTRKLLMTNLFGMALLENIRQIKDEYYRENEHVHISEFNKCIDRELHDEPVPFIYERVGNRYYSYLIDEFQDTSRLQFHNFLPLIVEALSRGGADGPCSLVVGDGKQAIYRFRQGDVRQFIDLPHVNGDWETDRVLCENAEKVRLDTNYRTMKNVVDFNNRFFSWAVRTYFLENKTLKQLYLGDEEVKEDAQLPLWQKSKREGGYVELQFVEKELICQQVADAVRRQVEDLHYSYGDILILARDNATLVTIADYLMSHIDDPAFRLVTSESFLLSNSRVVRFLQAMLRYLADRCNRVAAAAAVELYEEIKGSDTSHVGSSLLLLRSCGYDLTRYFETATKGEVRFDRDYLRALSLYDCCEELLRVFGLEGKESTYVSTLLNVVNGFMQHHRSDLNAFNSYLEEKISKLSSSTASDGNALQLMTIHKAKGLENHIVIYAMPKPDTHVTKLWVSMKDSEKLLGSETVAHLPVAYVTMQQQDTIFNSQFDEERQLADMDRINLLYVALTRPRQKLLVVSENSASDGTDNNSLLCQFAHADTSGFRKEGDERFAIGEDFNSPEDQKQEVADGEAVSDSERLSNVVFPEWEHRVMVAEQNQSTLSPLDDDSRRWGLLIHDLMAHIMCREEVRPVVDKYCSSHQLAPETAADLCRRIETMMDREENRCFFEKGQRVLCEAPLVVNQKILRPDRIIFGTDHTWVVDFKTGQYDPTRHKEYQQQVAGYVQAIAAMGYPNVSGTILYL